MDNDILILEKEFIVKRTEVNTAKGLSFFTALIKQYFYLLFNIYKYEIVFIWFADYHSFLPVFFSSVFNKKTVINIGGYDADEILIGVPKTLREKFRKFCVTYSVKNASLLLPVSNVIKNHLLTEVNEEKCKTIYCCINTEKFEPKELAEKENIIVTVGGGGFVKEAKRKRLDFFIMLGNEFNSRYPEYNAKFLAIGHEKKSDTYLFLTDLIKNPNVQIMPVTKSVSELVEYYYKASIYMQLSYYEAFGIAQIEAMLYGCIPVSNPGGAIGEVIGNAGFTVEHYDKERYIQLFKEILDKKHEDLRIKAKERVLANFTLEARKKKLIPLLKDLL